MHRREVLRLLGTGTVLQLAPTELFAVLREMRALIQTPSSPRTLNPHQYATVKTMAELIIPRTETPGATDVSAADFVDLMLTEWCEESERSRFLAGINDVDSRTTKLFGKNFVDCSATQQGDTLARLGAEMAEEHHSGRTPALTGRGAKPAQNFYAMLRQITLTAYYTSEAGATKELHFELIPGMYEGCSHVPAVKEAPEQK